MSRYVIFTGTFVMGLLALVVSCRVARCAQAAFVPAAKAMKPLLVLLGIASFLSCVEGAVVPGENLLLNGGFDAEQVDFPEFWSPSSSRDVIYCRSGGPEGKKASLVLKSDGTTPGTVSARQQGMTLAAGETYKLSAYIKTKGFQSRQAGLVIHNNGWTSAVGITNLPVDAEWAFHEKTFTLIPSDNKQYGLAMFAVNPTGEIHFAVFDRKATHAVRKAVAPS